ASLNTSDAYLALSLAHGIGPVRTRALRDHFGNVEAVLVASEGELTGAKGIGAQLARQIRDSLQRVDVAAGRRAARERGVEIVTYEDARYPEALREIYDPPLALYIRGKIPNVWARGVGIVGSRQTTQYGLETAKKLAYQIAYAGVPVVSGLARGIDT